MTILAFAPPARHGRMLCRRLHLPVLTLLSFLAAAGCRPGGARPDRDFRPVILRPAYTRDGPVVLFDEGHHNGHTISGWPSAGTYKPFATLLEADGYQVRRHKAEFTAKALEEGRVLVIVNALGRDEQNSTPAFTEEEADAVAAWVRQGGSLLLVTDHFPTGHAAERLGARFGVRMTRGTTQDSTRRFPGYDASHIVFSRENGGLGDHPILRGRDSTERVDRVVTFTGQSLRGPAGSVPLLVLGPDAVDLAPAPKVERRGGDVIVEVRYGDATPATGGSQALAMEFGAGRVVVFAEAAGLSAQLDAVTKKPFGMNVDGLDNQQLVLNVLHWLSRRL